MDAWVADRLGRLDAATARSLTDQYPDWRARAATLIAEGLLAYVAMEMVAPDLAIAAVSAGHDGWHATDDEVLTARLGAHLRDFIDYRDMLPAPGPIPPCTLHHDPPTGPPTGPAS